MIPAAVLFDCDGVVVDSEPATFALIREDLAAHGLTLTAEEADHHFLGGTIRGVGDKARSLGARLPPLWHEDFYDRLYGRLAEGTPLIGGVVAVFDALDAAGVPYAIGSNGTGRKMAVTLGQHPDLVPRLRDRCFSGQDLGMLKPAPDLYLHAARALGVDPAACVVIEDSATGARAARGAGMRCLGYAPKGVAPALAAEGARLFSAMADLPALLGLHAGKGAA